MKLFYKRTFLLLIYFGRMDNDVHLSFPNIAGRELLEMVKMPLHV